VKEITALKGRVKAGVKGDTQQEEGGNIDITVKETREARKE
jgi:hypothetical protein